MELFREQATRSRHDSWLGTVDLISSSTAWPSILLLTALLGVCAGFLAMGRMSRSAPAQGQLLPATGLLPVVAPRSGTVVRVFVAEGASVAQGQPLFEISSELRSKTLPGVGLGDAIRSELQAQKRLLEEDLIWVNSAERSYNTTAREQAEHLGRQLKLLDDQYRLAQQNARLSRDLFERVSKLDVGILSALQLQQYESDALNAGAEVKRLQQQREKAQFDYDNAMDRLQAVPVDIVEKRNRIERALSDVDQALARNATDGRQLVVAPRSGTVSVLSVHTGQSVDQGARILSLIPEGAELVAELWVPSSTVGSLSPGMRVAMRYEAFPYRQFGHQHGHVTRISGSALMPEEVLALSGVTVKEPSYRITVALDEQQPRYDGQRLHLRPNMAVHADLLLERQPLYRLLLPGDGAVSDTTQES